ncbi:unnamed protein product [Symbiodinium natans]|uniref:Uncharacterized protein n=1 Tax=Symbiodinium natans TaxID=878477 RepID=A0A812NPM2_9DINO|nr:unnamed protein product [Symbiodinium natans]
MRRSWLLAAATWAWTIRCFVSPLLSSQIRVPHVPRAARTSRWRAALTSILRSGQAAKKQWHMFCEEEWDGATEQPDLAIENHSAASLRRFVAAFQQGYRRLSPGALLLEAAEVEPTGRFALAVQEYCQTRLHGLLPSNSQPPRAQLSLMMLGIIAFQVVAGKATADAHAFANDAWPLFWLMLIMSGLPSWAHYGSLMLS